MYDNTADRVIKSVRPTHGGLEYIIQTMESKYVITGADFRRIGEDVLFAGNSIHEQLVYELEFSSEKLSCIQKALKHLDYAQMTENRLKMKLSGKFSREAIEEALEILKENGYIDDMRFGMDLCEELFVNGCMGPVKIKSKLYQKGFSRECVSAIFEEFEFSDEQTHENMRKLVFRKFGDEIPEEWRGKAFEYLVRWGYSYEDAKSFLKIY